MPSDHRSEEQCLDERRLAADLEQNPLFSQGCWHCARLLHRCRRLTGAEAPVESWVGEVKRLWDPVQGGAAATLANQLFEFVVFEETFLMTALLTPWFLKCSLQVPFLAEKKRLEH